VTFGRLIVVVLGLALIGGVVLSLRQQRLVLLHEITALHREMDACRKRMWDAQVRIAEPATPSRLVELTERAGLELESATPPRAPAAAPGVLAQHGP